MAKKRPSKRIVPESSPDEPMHSAFAGLAALRDRLPAGVVVKAPVRQPKKPADTATRVVVRRERKGRKGKTVTRVSGLSGDLAHWAQRLKRELGCGGAVEDSDIVLAGDIGDRVADWLRAAGIETVARGN